MTFLGLWRAATSQVLAKVLAKVLAVFLLIISIVAASLHSNGQWTASFSRLRLNGKR